ncbi:phage terminase large subunit [Elizabethkingia anophelis]|uniref:phage terminase large subunit n=1 Tax=Elizabethkingia anophelis TaxID=1117645 RepID=UPI0032096DA8
MSLTDSEILELEKLLHEDRVEKLFYSLDHITSDTSPNYKQLYEALNSQKWGIDKQGRPVLESGYIGVALEGSSRSTKTWSGIYFIIYLATIKHKKSGCSINIYRETYNEFKTTLYDDFKRILDLFDLPNPFHNAKEVHSFKIFNTTIHFLGDGKHGGGCDYAFFNEAMMIKKTVFNQVVMRCRIFWWMDYNPSFTDHWVFDSVITRSNVAFLRTTFRDNKFISPTELNEILGYEPWLPGSYEVTEDGIFYNDLPVTEEHQPPPHPVNVDQGTADEFMWKVYGLGLRGAMKGVIFQNVRFIDKFPDMGYIYVNDFGFTSDPNAFDRYAETETEIFIEPLIYEPVETPDLLDTKFQQLGIEYDVPIICDSSDKRVTEDKGTIQMVQDLQEYGWSAQKVVKNRSVMYWILSMKKKRINIVRNHLYKYAKKEQENYKFMEINGILINQPIDKYNHMWDSARYGHMAWNSMGEIETEWN